jgi:hypothetical protein
VAFVRPGRAREKNLFPNTGDATDLIKWHMPLVPATIVKRNAVIWNSRSSRRCFLGTETPSLIQQTIGIRRALSIFARFHDGAPHRDRTGVSRRRTPSALPAKLTTRALMGATNFFIRHNRYDLGCSRRLLRRTWLTVRH